MRVTARLSAVATGKLEYCTAGNGNKSACGAQVASLSRFYCMLQPACWKNHPPQYPVGGHRQKSISEDFRYVICGIGAWHPGIGLAGWVSCEVMVRKCRRYIDPCPGGRATHQAVFRSCRLGLLPPECQCCSIPRARIDVPSALPHHNFTWPVPGCHAPIPHVT